MCQILRKRDTVAIPIKKMWKLSQGRDNPASHNHKIAKRLNWIWGSCFLTLQSAHDSISLKSSLVYKALCCVPSTHTSQYPYAFYALDFSALNTAVRDRWKAVMKSTGRNILVQPLFISFPPLQIRIFFSIMHTYSFCQKFS